MAPRPVVAVGIDVGGTKALAVAIDADAQVVAEARRPTPLDADGLEAALLSLASEVADAAPGVALGIGVPGLVTPDGVLRAAPHLREIRELPLARRLHVHWPGSVVVDNDNTCAAVGEWTIGAGRGAHDLLFVGLGTGIGAGVIAGGAVQRGAHGFAGEVGHVVVQPDGIACVCGRRGCWERYASGSGLAIAAREAALAGALPAVVELAGGESESVRGEHVVAAAAAGDRDALAVLDRFAGWVALGLANLVNVLDPSVVVLGGGLMAAGELLVSPVRAALPEMLYAAANRVVPDVRAAALGEHAGALGAALLALAA